MQEISLPPNATFKECRTILVMGLIHIHEGDQKFHFVEPNSYQMGDTRTKSNQMSIRGVLVDGSLTWKGLRINQLNISALDYTVLIVEPH